MGGNVGGNMGGAPTGGMMGGMNEMDGRTYTQVGNTPCAHAQIGDLVINEILANPEGNESSTQDEWIEIVNRTALPILLDRLELFYQGMSRLRFGTLCLPAYSALTLFNQQPASFWMWSTPFIGQLESQAPDEFTLVNSADIQLDLKNSEGLILSTWSSISNQTRSGISLNRDPDLSLTVSSILHTLLSNSNGDAFSPGRCPNGLRYENQCTE